VTPLLKIRATSSVWHPETKKITLAYMMKNTSKDTITGPFKLRITGLSSDLGYAAFGPGDSIRADGAVKDITSSLPSGRLAPGETSPEIRMEVPLDSLYDLRGPSTYRDALRFTAKVFANKRLALVLK
jgi:hypothetical protein